MGLNIPQLLATCLGNLVYLGPQEKLPFNEVSSIKTSISGEILMKSCWWLAIHHLCTKLLQATTNNLINTNKSQHPHNCRGIAFCSLLWFKLHSGKTNTWHLYDNSVVAEKIKHGLAWIVAKLHFICFYLQPPPDSALKCLCQLLWSGFHFMKSVPLFTVFWAIIVS